MNVDTVIDAYNEALQAFGAVTSANQAAAHREAMKAAIKLVAQDCAQAAESHLANNPGASGPDVRDWIIGHWFLLVG